MKKLFLLILSFILAFNIQLQAQRDIAINDPDVGIVEHLNDTLPLDLIFLNENNDSVTLRSLITKPTVLSFVYFDCPGMCSPLLDGVSEVIENTDLELGKDYEVLTISFNFRDNPDKARDKKKNFLQKHSKERAEHWHYLTTDSATIFEITHRTGFLVKPIGFDFLHASAIIIVSPEGKITRYLYGVSYLPFDFKMAISEASRGIAQPSINRVLDFCFSYDPQGRRYTLQVTRIVGAISLLMIVIVLIILFATKRGKKNE